MTKSDEVTSRPAAIPPPVQVFEVTRTDVIQAIIRQTSAVRYLEIGVFRGLNFLPLDVAEKHGVDPDFQIASIDRLKWAVLKPKNLRAKYYPVTSDDFFAGLKTIDLFHVVFIDGLHTYEQSYRDVVNAVAHLHDNGVIVMHDCRPPHAASAYPADSLAEAAAAKVPGWNGEWCGDVWKTIVRLRADHPNLDVFVLDTDYGLGIVRKRPATTPRLEFSADEIASLEFDDLQSHIDEWLNLRPVSAFDEFLAQLTPIT